MPAIGLGTFGSDHVSHDEVAAAVVGAAEVGYRHFDCAAVYGNEEQIGRSLQTVMGSGVTRDDLWITSKVWNDMHDQVGRACRLTFRDLRLEALDLYLVHWPFPNHHPPGCSIDDRNPDATPYVHDVFMQTWLQMERLVDDGLVRHIGTSNVSIAKLELILRDAGIAPAVNEMELHPHFQQPELFDYVIAKGIVPVGFSPIGSPARPARDRTADDTVDIDDPVVIDIAARHGIHPATLCVKWAVQHGHVPIPFSVTRRNYLANLRSTVSASLTDDEMRALGRIDRNNRLIKGQVFLWRDGQPWQDLWDLDGTIAH